MDSIPQWLQGFVNLAGLAGVASLIWNIINELRRRARLKICEVREPVEGHGHLYFCVEVHNTGGISALQCRGTAKSEPLVGSGKSREVHDLHWAHDSVGEDTFDKYIIIGKRNNHRLDVVLSTSQVVPVGLGGAQTSSYLATNRDAKGGVYQESSELAPGKHHIKIEVTCDNGNTASFSKELLVPLKL
jgi:hypothetical protein